MKKVLFRCLAVFMCLAMVFSLAACSKDKGDIASGTLLDFEDETGEGLSGDNNDAASGTVSGEGTTSGATGGNTITEQIDISGKDPFAKVPARLRGTTVKFAQWGDEGASEYQKVAKAFTKKTGIKIEWVNYDENTYVSTIAQQIAAKSGPDIIICNEIFPHAFEIAQPLQNLVDLKDDFWDDSVTEVCTVNGNTYFVNSRNSVWKNLNFVFYNKKLFSDNRITSPKDYYKRGEWTYENLRKCLEQIAKTGNTGGYVDPEMMAAAMGNGLIQYDAKTQKFSQNITKAASAFQYCATNIEKKLWDPVLWFGNFSNGTIGLYMYSVWGTKYNGWFKEADPSIVAAVPLPTSYNGQHCYQTESLRAYGVAKGSKNPEGAGYFLRYYLDYEYYDDAGADVFLNDSLEDAYFEVVDIINKEGIKYYFDRGIFDYTTVTAADIKNVGLSATAQVSGTLASYENQFVAGVKKMNEKVAGIK